MTFQLLMSEHTLLTIHYFESLFGGEKNGAATEMRAKWLFSQIDLWVPYFGPGGARWKEIMVEHTQLAAEAGQKVYQNKDPSSTIDSLMENMKAVMAHLQKFGYAADQVKQHWTKHLNCTVTYLKALRASGSASSSFQAAKQECVQFANQFGVYLDTATAFQAANMPSSVSIGNGPSNPNQDIIF